MKSTTYYVVITYSKADWKNHIEYKQPEPDDQILSPRERLKCLVSRSEYIFPRLVREYKKLSTALKHSKEQEAKGYVTTIETVQQGQRFNMPGPQCGVDLRMRPGQLLQ